LFIDVDGVLFAEYDGFLNLRPGVNSFLKWCTENFECAWLTCWGQFALKDLFRSTYGSGVARKIDYCNWQPYEGNKAKGALEYAAGRTFLWIEDGLPPEERELLNQKGLLDSYIYVNPNGKNELYQVQRKLKQRLKDMTGGDQR
jgi:hypothetical protein